MKSKPPEPRFDFRFAKNNMFTEKVIFCFGQTKYTTMKGACENVCLQSQAILNLHNQITFPHERQTTSEMTQYFLHPLVRA